MLDVSTGQVEADIPAIAALEEAAYRAKYGKLHPDLYERLQTVDEAETSPVAIWLAPDPTVRTQAEVLAELADRYAAEHLAMIGNRCLA